VSGVKTFMRHIFTLTAFLIIIIIAGSCRKDKKTTECFPNSTTIRQITNKQAVVKLTATVKPVYIIEQGSIDTKLIPCNFSHGILSGQFTSNYFRRSQIKASRSV